MGHDCTTGRGCSLRHLVEAAAAAGIRSCITTAENSYYVVYKWKGHSRYRGALSYPPKGNHTKCEHIWKLLVNRGFRSVVRLQCSHFTAGMLVVTEFCSPPRPGIHSDTNFDLFFSPLLLWWDMGGEGEGVGQPHDFCGIGNFETSSGVSRIFFYSVFPNLTPSP